MEGIPISAADIDEFVQSQTAEEPDNPAEAAQKQQTADWVSLLFRKGLDICDNILEQQDERYGHSEQMKQGFSDVAGIWASKEFTIEQLKQSPRAFMAFMTLAYFSPTAITYTEIKKESEGEDE